MSTDRTLGAPLDAHAAASIEAPTVQVAPGEVANATLSVTNRRAEATSFALSVSGLEAGWYGLPDRIGPLEPGERAEVPFHVSLPRGYPPCALLVAVEARPLATGADGGDARGSLPGRKRPSPSRDGGASGDERRAPGRHDVQVVVGDGATVVARLEPPEVGSSRRHRRRFAVLLRNRGSQSQKVRVDGVSPDPHLELHFHPRSPLLLPGREVEVAGRVRTRRHLFGESHRYPFAVRVQGRGTPAQAEGSYTSHPLLPSWASKTIIIGVVVALWAAVAVVGIRALSDHLHHSAAQKAALSSPSTTGGKSTAGKKGSPGSSSPGKTGHATSPGAPSKGSGNASPPGSSSSSTPPSGPSSSSPSPGATVEVTGKVRGSKPGGVTVTLAPTSLVSTQVAGARGGGSPGATVARAVHALGLRRAGRRHGDASSGSVAGAAGGPQATLTAAVHRQPTARPRAPTSASMPRLVGASHRTSHLPDGKVYGTAAAAAFYPGLTASVTPTLTTKTEPDGAFVFTGVPAPGTYLVSFTEPGYTTRKYVVQTSKGKSVSLDTALSPGTGSLSGHVTGPHGPLGGVSITVTNGSVTLTTVTPTTGKGIGTWSISGLSTPDTYSVSASAPGYGTQITTASLKASASLAGVDLKLVPGVGSISGTVTAASSGKPLGDVTVSATDGSTTATATTSTVTPIGSYTLPNLAIPSTWTLTVSGPGWMTQTQAVTLTGNTTVNATLTASGANVIGVVSSGGSGLANVGLELSNTNTKLDYKTLSESASPVGGFDFGQIPPGQYVLSATRFGYTAQSASVDVKAGQTKTVDLTLPHVGTSNLHTGTITGSVVNAYSGKPVATVPMELDGKSATATTNADGVYTIGDVAPGLHQVTALGTTENFADAGVQVRMAQGATVTAPVIALPGLSKLTGLVVSAVTGTPIPTPTVRLLEGGTAVGTPVQYTSTTKGTYTITDITAGNYVLEVTAPGYTQSDTNVAIGPGQVLTQNVSLAQGPTYKARTFVQTSSGSLQAKGGVCVVVSRVTGTGLVPTAAALSKSQGPSTPTGGHVTIPDLVSGDAYVAMFALPTSTVSSKTTCVTLPKTTITATAPSDTFTAKPDNTTVYPAVLSQPHGKISITLEFPYYVKSNTGATAHTRDCPVAVTNATATPPTTPPSTCPAVTSTPATLPTVTVTGTTGYATHTNGTPGSAQSATVALTHIPDTNEWIWTTTAVTFVSTQVTLKVHDAIGQFETMTRPITLPSAGTTSVTELLIPVPVPVTGKITPTSGVTVTVRPDQIAPSSLTNTLTATDTIGVIEGTGGALQWSDPAANRGGAAQPGIYTLTLSATGYESVGPVTVTVGLCTVPVTGNSCTRVTVPSSSLRLSQKTSLVIDAHNVPGTSLGAPTVSLRYNGTTVATSPKTLTVTPRHSTTGTVTFTGALLPSKGTGYSYEISGPGIETSTGTIAFTATTGAFTTATHGAVTETVTLRKEGWLRGTVEGILVPGATGAGATQALQGATVTATLTTPTTTTPSTPSPPGCHTSLHTTTGATGAFLLVGTTGGLCTGTYTLAVHASTLGFATTTTAATVTIAPGENSLSASTLTPLTVVATQLTQTVVISGLQPGVTVTVAATSSIGPTATCAITIPTTSPSTATCTKVTATAKTTGTATFTFTLYPVTYSFTVSAPTYETTTLGPVPYSPGETPSTLSYTLVQQQVTVTGTVTVSATGRQAGAQPITTLPLTLKSTSGTGVQRSATSATVTVTGTTTNYSFSTVPKGNYAITAGAGYTTIEPITFSTGTASQLTEDFTVYAPPVPLALTVTDPLTGLANGTTVTLTPTSAATSVTDSCGSGHTLLEAGLGTTQTATAVGSKTGKTASASFSDVVPDVYTVSFSGVGSGTDSPTPSTHTLVVCPSPATAPVTTPTPPIFTLGIGKITTTVTLATPPSTPPTVTMSATTLSATCTPSTTATCTMHLLVDLSTTLTVTYRASGYTTKTKSVKVRGHLTTTVTLKPKKLALALKVKAPAGAAGTAVAAATHTALVSLTRQTVAGATPITATTNSTGVATLSVVKTATYKVSVTPNLTGATGQTLGTFTATATATTHTVTLETGNVTGAITLTRTAATTTAVAVTVSVGSTGCRTVTVGKNKHTAPYACTLPVGIYTLTFTPTTTSTYAAGTLTTVLVTTAGESTENVTLT